MTPTTPQPPPLPVHQEIFVDAQGRRVPPEQEGARRHVAEFWSAQRLAQFQRAGFPRASAPAFAAEAESRPGPGRGPRILSPQAALHYVLRIQDASKNSIALDADAAPGIRKIHWFAGDGYLGSSEPAQPLLWRPAPGHWIIRAIDEEGRAARTEIHVSAAP